MSAWESEICGTVQRGTSAMTRPRVVNSPIESKGALTRFDVLARMATTDNDIGASCLDHRRKGTRYRGLKTGAVFHVACRESPIWLTLFPSSIAHHPADKAAKKGFRESVEQPSCMRWLVIFPFFLILPAATIVLDMDNPRLSDATLCMASPAQCSTFSPGPRR